MPACQSCHISFRYNYDLQQHFATSPQHNWPCDTCDDVFTYENCVVSHMNQLNHWAPIYDCESCTAIFATQHAADRHMEALEHYKFYCKPCKKRFSSQNNLNMHLHSRVHQGTEVKCPFCARSFVTSSGVAHHLEYGSCPKAQNVNRKTIYEEIRKRDTDGVITNKLLEWNQQYEATDRCWNGNSYECYICHRKYITLDKLNNHLNNGQHREKLYHCPGEKRGCGGQFVSLAALFGHLESETCGYARFEKMKGQVGKMLTQGGRGIGF